MTRNEKNIGTQSIISRNSYEGKKSERPENAYLKMANNSSGILVVR